MRDEHHTLTLLTRLAQRQPDQAERLEQALVGRLQALAEPAVTVAVETGDPLGQVLAVLVHERPLPELVERLAERCEESALRNVVTLRELAAVVAQQQLIWVQAKSPSPPRPEDWLAIAKSYDRLAGRLVALGRWQEALQYHEEAADLWRDIARVAEGLDVTGQAMNLVRMAELLGRRGSWARALAALEEGLPILRRLVASETPELLEALGIAVGRYGIVLSELKRPEQALAANQEAVEIFRQLGERQPWLFQPGLASSLVNLGGRLREQGRNEEALVPLQEALALRRIQAAERPETFLPTLALVLHDLGALLEDLERWEDSIAATSEAVSLRRRLAAARPAAFVADLAGSLRNLSLEITEVGRLEEALAPNGEALAGFREVLAAAPERFAQQLAKLHGRRCSLLRDLKRYDELFEAAEAGLREVEPHFKSAWDELGTHLGMLYGSYLIGSQKTGRFRDPELTARVAARLGG